jgi:NAD(P)-dependent dehydrogenase (short-subunit alcohol dehydrogenase family)
VVTGGARGIGLGICHRFAAEGADLLLVDRLKDELAAASGTLRQSGARVETLHADVTEKSTPNQILEQAVATHGKVDILVNCAGLGGGATLEQVTDYWWDLAINTNLAAAFRISRAIVPHMAQRSYGRVINISSMCGTIGMREDCAYAIAKAGTDALSRSIAADYGVHGITANSIAPGTIETPRTLAGNMLGGPKSWFLDTIVGNKPVPGVGRVEDIAAAAAFLASEDARFISGHVIYVDGGLTFTRFVPNNDGADNSNPAHISKRRLASRDL